ncbi:hypothetical protein [Sediminibacillus massiliensis]|uniref:hypothetical protein n=1 Tax=Sediminibacillus massiliensis TaxID=1926277 RepID=UPI0009885FBA|nr:hypothetical protein [Sediminibacillus massiliensis]
MKKLLLSVLLLLLTVFTAACSTTQSEEKEGNSSDGLHNKAFPDALAVLAEDEDADILQVNKRVYKANIGNLESLELTKENLIGTIEATFQEGKEFTDNMATKLPIGAEVYSTTENGVLIAEYEGETVRYRALLDE